MEYGARCANIRGLQFRYCDGESPKVGAQWDYWSRLRINDSPPQRQNIDPVEIKALSPTA